MTNVRRLVRITAGWTLIAIGVIATFIPVFPQLPFLAAGALLLAPYVRIFGRLSAWVHSRYPRLRPPLRRFRDFKRPPPGPPGNSP